MKSLFIGCAAVGLMALVYDKAAAQPTATAAIQTTSADKAKVEDELEKKATEWVASLKLSDAAKEDRVRAVIATHLRAIRDWNNDHPFTMVPAGINPATGNKLSDLDRQIIAN